MEEDGKWARTGGKISHLSHEKDTLVKRSHLNKFRYTEGKQGEEFYSFLFFTLVSSYFLYRHYFLLSIHLLFTHQIYLLTYPPTHVFHPSRFLTLLPLPVQSIGPHYDIVGIKKIAASSMLHEAKIAYYAFDAAILFASTIGPAVAKAT